MKLIYILALTHLVIGYFGYIIAYKNIKLKTLFFGLPCSFYGIFSYFIFKDIANSKYVEKTTLDIVDIGYINNTPTIYIDCSDSSF